MQIDLNELNTNKLYDICIIGTGPAGLSLFSNLVNKGLNLALIESGNINYDGSHDELNFGKSIGKREIDVENSRLRAFGGAGKIWAGVCRHYTRDEFERFNWPINYDEINKYYLDAYELFGLSNNYDEDLQNKFYQYQNFKDILGDDSYFFGKTYLQSSEYDRDLTNKFKNIILKSNKIDLITNATALDFDLDNSASANSIVVSSKELKKTKIKSKIYVLCIGALETCRFLINSNLYNIIESENLSLGFMSHPGFSIIGKIYLDDRCIQNLPSNFERKKYKFFNFELNQKIQKKENILGHSVSVSPVIIKNQILNGKYKELFENLNYLDFFNKMKCKFKNSELSPKEWNVSIGIEQEFSVNNYMKLSSTEFDIFNKPIMEISWDHISEKEIKTIQKACFYLSKQLMISKLGIFEYSEELINGSIFLQDDIINHHIGLTRMSNNPKKGVVDKNLKIHGVENVFISSSSVFPSSSSINPTLTISALSLRLGDYILNQKKIFDL